MRRSQRPAADRHSGSRRNFCVPSPGSVTRPPAFFARPSTLLVALTVLGSFAHSGTAPAASAVAGGKVSIDTLRTLSRLSFVTDGGTRVETKTLDEKGFSLLFRGVQPLDLGFPAGGADGDALATLADERLGRLRVRAVDGDTLVEGEWHYPGGSEALAHPAMETFLYQDVKEGRWVFDFWVKTGPTRKSSDRARAIAKTRAEELASQKIAAERVKLQAEEAAEARSDSNLGQFCDEPLKEGMDVFLPFYPLHEELDFSRYFSARKPDEAYPYLEPVAQNDDAQYYRLALSLYRKDKLALALRTLDFHDENVKKTEFGPDLEFLRANIFWKLGQKDKATALFTTMMDRYPGHPSALFAALQLAYDARAAENSLRVYELYTWLATRYPAHEQAWVFRMVAGEALYGMKQTERAAEAYDWLIENAPTREAKAAASIRTGDVHLYRRQYDKAVAAYFRAQSRFPEEAAASPYLQMNRAESLYWLGQYDKAAEGFRGFLQKFSGNPAGWRALLRLAEIEGRRAGGKGIPEMRKRLLETVNRYPTSPGSTLARLRLIPCGDHAGYTLDSAVNFFDGDVAKFENRPDAKEQILLDGFDRMKATLAIQSFIQFGDLTRALDAASAAATELGTRSPAYGWLTGIQRKLFRKNLVALLDQGKNYEAAKFFDERIGRVALEAPDSPETRADRENEERKALDVQNPQYLLRLARAVAGLGLGSLSEKVISAFEKAEAQYEVARFSTVLRYRKLGLEGRRRSEKAFTVAVALFARDPIKNEGKIREALNTVRDDSPYSFSKALLLARLAENTKSLQGAIAEIQRARILIDRDDPAAAIHAATLDQWIADLQTKIGAKFAALSVLDEVLGHYPSGARSDGASAAKTKPDAEALPTFASLGIVPLATRADLIARKAEIYTSLGRWGDVAKTYEDLLVANAPARGDAAESVPSVEAIAEASRVKVELARALIKTGKRGARARSLLEEVAAAPAKTKDQGFWRELAQKTLAGIDAGSVNGGGNAKRNLSGN